MFEIERISLQTLNLLEKWSDGVLEIGLGRPALHDFETPGFHNLAVRRYQYS